MEGGEKRREGAIGGGGICIEPDNIDPALLVIASHSRALLF